MIRPKVQQVLQKDWIELIRAEAAEAQQLGQLTPKQLALFYREGWFKALVPKLYGGLEWSFGKIVRFEEAIGWVDGSAGWVFTLASGAGWFAGYLDAGLSRSLFASATACLVGSGAVAGSGRLADKGGYRVTGKWSYATGAPHGTAFTANVWLEDQKLVRPFVFLPSEVEVHKTWYPIGLIASASESFEVKDVYVEQARGFLIDPDQPVVHSPLYRLPFGALAEATIAANLSGMALRFMEELEALWQVKYLSGVTSRPRPHWLSGAELLLRQLSEGWMQLRKALLDEVDGLEVYVNQHMDVCLFKEDLLYNTKSAAVSSAAQALAHHCRLAVNQLYPFTGLTGADRHSLIGKVWRDFQTGSQHALFTPSPGC